MLFIIGFPLFQTNKMRDEEAGVRLMMKSTVRLVVAAVRMKPQQCIMYCYFEFRSNRKKIIGVVSFLNSGTASTTLAPRLKLKPTSASR